MHTSITHVGKNVVFVDIKSITLDCYNFLLKRYINLSLAQDIVVVHKQILESYEKMQFSNFDIWKIMFFYKIKFFEKNHKNHVFYLNLRC